VRFPDGRIRGIHSKEPRYEPETQGKEPREELDIQGNEPLEIKELNR